MQRRYFFSQRFLFCYLFFLTKKNTDFLAFDRQLAVEAAVQFGSTASRTISSTAESMLFVDVNEDTYTPMNIMAMVELSDCRSICGGVYAAQQGTAADDATESSRPEQNKDTCIAIAGLPSNNTVMVKKYCVPKAQVLLPPCLYVFLQKMHI